MECPYENECWEEIAEHSLLSDPLPWMKPKRNVVDCTDTVGATSSVG